MNSRMMDEDDIRAELIKTRSALKQMTAYADDLVSKIPFLPKDIDNLREANLTFATENFELSKEKSAFLEAILNPFATYERARVSEAVKAALQASNPNTVVSTELIETITALTISEVQNVIFSRKNDRFTRKYEKK